MLGVRGDVESDALESGRLHPNAMSRDARQADEEEDPCEQGVRDGERRHDTEKARLRRSRLWMRHETGEKAPILLQAALVDCPPRCHAWPPGYSDFWTG